jgi:hypothetical protein
MLRPSKHSHPDRTVISLAMLLLARLKEKRVEEFAKLRLFARTNVQRGDALFLPALSLLFVLGVVEYHRKTDAFEYRARNEAV